LNLGKGKIILDKHCIGGVAGNRTTMLVVPTIAAAELYIPKTSSRAITSASGTADTMELLANVNFNIDELKEMVIKAKGAIVWGGGMKLAPVDDKLIRVRHPLSLDPEGMLLASILAKKKSVGAKYVIIDIPVGRGVKIPYMEKANHLAKHFLNIGKSLGMTVEALITDGAEPVGNGVGPALECKDVLGVLEGNGPDDLRHKSILMSGKLLELSGKVKHGEGYNIAENIIKSGKALKKFREIIELQGGDAKVKATDMDAIIGAHSHIVRSESSGSIFHIDNKIISKIARLAGSPMDKGAGVYLHKLRGDKIRNGEPIFTIYAESSEKLSFAVKALKDLEPIEMRKMLLGTMR
jgi:AMP phosphorylase